MNKKQKYHIYFLFSIQNYYPRNIYKTNMYFIKIKSLIFMKWTKNVLQFRFVIFYKMFIHKQKDKFIECNLCLFLFFSKNATF